MDWFSGWHWAIVAVVFLVLFGSSRLPGAARALGSSMNIFKRSLKEGMSDDGKPADNASVTQAAVLPAAQPLTSTPAEPAQQAQIEDLQRQIQELQRTSASGDARPASGATTAEPRQESQP
jgi:sec-independent protein translocase protein TatA